jgi:hypothetical protein
MRREGKCFSILITRLLRSPSIAAHPVTWLQLPLVRPSAQQ